MMLKNVLAVLLIIAIFVSLIATASVLIDFDFGKEKEIGKAQIKLYVAEKEEPHLTAALVKLNVVEKQS